MAFKFIKKYYVWIALIIFAFAITLDLNFKDAIPIVTKQKHVTPAGQIQYIDILTYPYKNELMQIVSSILYSLSVSLLILIGIEVKYDEGIRELEKTNYENDKKKYEEKISNLNDEINKNIFEGLLKKIIPLEVFDLIKKEVISKSVIARNTLWIYDIEENQKNSFDLKMTLGQELHNTSKTTISDSIEITIDASPKSRFEYFKCEKSNHVLIEKNVDNIHEILSESNSTIKLLYEFELEPGEYVKVISTLLHSHNEKIVSDPHWFKKSNIDFTLEVNKPRNSEFTILPTFSEKMDTQICTSTKILYKKIPCVLQGQGYSYIIKNSS